MPYEETAKEKGFKSLHYEHMKEWLQKQENAGNIVKFALMDSKYCVGFQRTTYKGRKPHFFIYEILKRKVIRRFMPLLDAYKKEWWQDPHGSGFFYVNKSAAKTGSNDSTSDADIHETEGSEAFLEDVSVFEISPRGSFMVSYVSQDFLVLKMLPRAMNTEDRRLMTSSYMVLEHIPLNMMD